MKKVLTIAGGVAVAGSQAGGTGHPLPHAVAHVAPGGGHQVVRHEARAVAHLNNTRTLRKLCRLAKGVSQRVRFASAPLLNRSITKPLITTCNLWCMYIRTYEQ